ncbi:ATP-binding protein [Labrys monachus]|uniref:ATPase/DNA-binding winged helix-turn-helix (WHTH) protein n=1 Tax=Labrys monachus TaxID=217067 RepID=A0ABU0FGD7_9HYPH|nr:winged helix-turn-helix domain-containing protein [Labrys monachus]MDQ0393407.1 putative ATPase/DNA-binding winged helix-turn-helix (wHTH) protein [Labrys monachus]
MAAGDVISFGPFRLIPEERLLLRDGEAVGVGNRVLDVLVALVETAGEVVSQRDLIARAWPGVMVGDGSLRVTIASLRKALGDGEDGARYVANVTGRGYCFVAPVDRAAAQPSASAPLPPLPEARSVPKLKLPPRLPRMVGRDDAVEALSMLLASRRFVSVVGPGGMGKTTVAVSVAHALLDAFGNAVYFVDLGAVTDAAVVLSAVATALGSSVQAHDPLPGLVAFLAGRRILLVLDNCEHVIDAAASLTERLYNDAPGVHILATSREALRAEGEHVHFLTPLGHPPVREDLTAAEALATPAVQLFMERAFASGHSGALTDADAPTVAAICSRLDGIALAIELAGSRVGAYGLQGTADLLSNRFKLLWQGRRSAPPRHKTLAAMLDWSFNLLSDRERRVLRRLSIFVGVFTLEAAQAVAADDQIDAGDVVETIASLIDKSLVWIAPFDGITHHRLLDSTLAFAAEKLAQAEEANAVARRHALYYAHRLSSGAGEGVAITIEDVAFAAPYLGNIRAALEWSFSPAGEAAIGVELAAAAVPLLFDLTLFIECGRWCEQGLAALPADEEGSATHLTLQAFLPAAAMFTRGNGDDVGRAVEAALNLAETRGDRVYQMHLLVGLGIFLTRIGDFQGALRVARRGMAVAEATASPGIVATAESVLGVACHLVGDQLGTRRHCERGLAIAEAAGAGQVAFFGYDHEVRALIALARCYWLIGLPDRAAETARRVIDLATHRDDPVNLCMTLIFTTTVFLWRGDLDEAERLVRRLLGHAARHSLGPYHTLGMALSGELAVARGDPAEGAALLRRSLGVLHLQKHHALTPALHGALAEGLMKAGEAEEAAAVVDAGLALSEAFGETLNVPELLRLRGEVLLQTVPADPAGAERAFRLSLQQAEEQSALSLELRSAIGLARQWSSLGRSAEAADLLEGVHRRFGEGGQTKDLKYARQLLADLGR